MDAVKFFKEMERMCKVYRDNPYGERDCKGCPLEISVDECMRVDMEESEKIVEIIEIVERWSKEHPQRTYKDDFLEKFPKTIRKENGMPLVGWCDIHNGGNCLYVFEEDRDCDDCWDMEMEL